MRLPKWVEKEVKRIAKEVSWVMIKRNHQRLVECTTCGCLIYPSADNNFPRLEQRVVKELGILGLDGPRLVDRHYCKAHMPDPATYDPVLTPGRIEEVK